MVIPLIIFLLFLIAYVLFVVAILWHLSEYVMPGDKYRWMTNIFLASIIIFIVISIVLFFTIPWSDLFNL